MTQFIELGSGGAWPDAHRNPPSHLVLADEGGPILVDCGSGSTGSLVRAGVEPRDLSSILITHIHIDHCADLASLLFGAFLTGRTAPMNIFGPPGLSGLVSALFDQAYPFAAGMLKNLRSVDFDVRVVELAERESTPVAAGVSATAFRMKHGLVTYGYRLLLGDVVVAFSGDTEPCDELTELAQGANLLVQDCAWPDDNGPRPGHCIPAQIGPVAAAAGVEQVLLHHMFPPCVGHEEAMIASVKDAFAGVVVMGDDLLRVAL